MKGMTSEQIDIYMTYQEQKDLYMKALYHPPTKPRSFVPRAERVGKVTIIQREGAIYEPKHSL